MKGTISHERVAAVPANKVWEVYGSLRLPELVVKLVPRVATKVDVEVGDGGVGTIVYVTLPKGAPGALYQRELYVKVDNEHRVKEHLLIEGGVLVLGFLKYLVRFEIIENSRNSTTIRSIVEYELEQGHEASIHAATTAPLAAIAEAVSKYLEDQNQAGCLKVLTSKISFRYKLWFRRLFCAKISGAKVSDAM